MFNICYSASCCGWTQVVWKEVMYERQVTGWMNWSWTELLSAIFVSGHKVSILWVESESMWGVWILKKELGNVKCAGFRNLSSLILSQRSSSYRLCAPNCPQTIKELSKCKVQLTQGQHTAYEVNNKQSYQKKKHLWTFFTVLLISLKSQIYLGIHVFRILHKDCAQMCLFVLWRYA